MSRKAADSQSELRRSLRNPHPETVKLVDEGFDEWTRSLSKEDGEGLVDSRGGKPVRWKPGKGWTVGRR